MKVSCTDRKQAQDFGAKWDGDRKQWYAPGSLDTDLFNIWHESNPANPVYLEVPFDDLEKAKKLGAKWNNEKKQWYVPEYLISEMDRKWIPAPQDGPVSNVIDMDTAHEMGAFMETSLSEQDVTESIRSDKNEKSPLTAAGKETGQKPEMEP